MGSVNKKYLKGFNSAYLLAKNNPKLLQEILNTNSLNDYIQGLKDGKDVFEHVKVKSRSEELINIRSRKDRNRDIGFER